MGGLQTEGSLSCGIGVRDRMGAGRRTLSQSLFAPLIAPTGATVHSVDGISIALTIRSLDGRDLEIAPTGLRCSVG